MVTQIKDSIRTHFRFATLDMLFILAFVNLFQRVFGMENSIVGVIFTILMSASMARDLTARPLKHFLLQAAVLTAMAVCACLVHVLPPLAALPVNFAMLFLLLYAYTYEYANHLYFPYILSYLFLIFISPVEPAGLPIRLLGMATGAVCVMAYQFVMGGHRVHDVARDALTKILDQADHCIRCLLSGDGRPDRPEEVRESLCELSRVVYERRKRALCISDASFAMVDSGRGLEQLVGLLYELEGPVTPERETLLRGVSNWLGACRAFLQRETGALPPPDLLPAEADGAERELCAALSYINSRLTVMTLPETRTRYRETRLSRTTRLKAALGLSPVRLAYAARVAALLAALTLLVQALGLEHGKWLLFTAASVSLPYADDVPRKAKKRLAATVIGCLLGLAAFALVPSSAGRTAIMMLSGYCSFYFADYVGTFACSTVGALGGAVFLSAFGWSGVGANAAIRVGYVLTGAAVALLANCALFPFTRSRATRQLAEKYAASTDLLARLCAHPEQDPQLYYSLVIQTYLLENKLRRNAADGGLESVESLLARGRDAVHTAHRAAALP